MAAWASWTALLRPLAGESMFEAIERAGNYGVPLALLALVGIPRNWRSLFWQIESGMLDDQRLQPVRRILQVSTCLLLAGHGALGAIMGKGLLVQHYATRRRWR